MECLRSFWQSISGELEPPAGRAWQSIPADRCSPAQRAAVFNAAYAGYFVPMQMSPNSMANMERAYDIDLGRSAVAATSRAHIGLALLGRRAERAWLAAVGVVETWRRQGVARTLTTQLIGAAREAGAVQMTLEVIDQNAAARSLYTSLGFRADRELLNWRRPADADPLPIPRERLIPAPAPDLLEYFVGWHDQRPCWQNDAATFRNMVDRLRGYRLDLDGAPAAYALVSGFGDDVWLIDVGINPAAGSAAGRTLLQALANLYFGKGIRVTNVSADSGLCRILAALRFLVTVRQIEMVLEF
jgi:ribosomal protein S18 acetylase RimI-like enzyme